MLALLLDENLSDQIALQITAKRPDIPVYSAHDWEGYSGRVCQDTDQAILKLDPAPFCR